MPLLQQRILLIVLSKRLNEYSYSKSFWTLAYTWNCISTKQTTTKISPKQDGHYSFKLKHFKGLPDTINLKSKGLNVLTFIYM